MRERCTLFYVHWFVHGLVFASARFHRSSCLTPSPSRPRLWPLWFAFLAQALVKAQLKMGSDRESRKRAWEENELSSLAKAIVKFPAGSQNRE